VAAIAPGSTIKTNDEILYVGSDALPGQRLSTGSSGLLHVLMRDQSALTLGPDSELIIEAFSYDESTRQGNIRLKLIQGTLRVVGGHISKTNDAVIETPHGLVELRGGISVIQTRGGNTSAAFLFGQHMRVTSPQGQLPAGTPPPALVTRPGFGIQMSNQQISPPQPINPNNLASLLQNLERTVVRPNTSPAPSPATTTGLLISTQDRPTGSVAPSAVLANDRLQSMTNDPTNVVRSVLGSGQNPNQS
jgi:hypothetical protein